MLMDNVLFSDIFDYNEKLLDKYFRIGLNYDVVATKFNAGGRKAGLIKASPPPKSLRKGSLPIWKLN